MVNIGAWDLTRYQNWKATMGGFHGLIFNLAQFFYDNFIAYRLVFLVLKMLWYACNSFLDGSVLHIGAWDLTNETWKIQFVIVPKVINGFFIYLAPKKILYKTLHLWTNKFLSCLKLKFWKNEIYFFNGIYDKITCGTYQMIQLGFSYPMEETAFK